jgi:hypothetical protein
MHGMLDYPAGVLLIAAPWIFAFSGVGGGRGRGAHRRRRGHPPAETRHGLRAQHRRHHPAAGPSLEVRAHRPWPVPDGRWIVGQTWRAPAFLHWPVATEDLRRVVPAELPLDVFDGSGWLAITPFEVAGHRLNGVRPVPVLSASRSSTCGPRLSHRRSLSRRHRMPRSRPAYAPVAVVADPA